MWAYPDFSDPRWQHRVEVPAPQDRRHAPASQKIGIANHQGWAGYLRHGTLFVKRVDWKDGATYPGWRRERGDVHRRHVRRAETLGPLVPVESGAAATHEERWFLFKDVKDDPSDAALAGTLAPLLATTR